MFSRNRTPTNDMMKSINDKFVETKKRQKELDNATSMHPSKKLKGN